MILLAALIFGLITFGFALLTLLPVILGFLAVGVYMEGKAHPAPEVAGADRPVPARAVATRQEALETHGCAVITS